MGLEVRNHHDVVILNPKGMLLGGRETDELQEKIIELDRAGNNRLLLNLGKLSFTSSMGLAVLFRAHASYSNRGATVKLCCVDKRIKQIFVMVRLGLVYGDNVHETEEEALAAFADATVPE
jgi:anti-anti-sigma factor